ncbi:MAG: glutamine synthetase beta-grasp domain-containing protein, partial [Thaumarchaeota archaeon]|nr:glutamine synthetase beta-grasp domain-containing protein [Nitrososphaerota archaeon]
MAFKRTQDGQLVTLKRTPQEVMDLIRTEKVEFVDLQFADPPGRLQHVTVPADQVEYDSFTRGMPKLDGSSIRGFAEIYESDMLLRPDPSTLAIIPWIPSDIKTARMFVDVYWGFEKGRLSRDPRGIAQRAEAVLTQEGYDLSLWGPEIEFFVFDRVTWDVSNPYQGQSYKIESKEAAWTTTGTNYPIRFKEGYYPVPPQDTLTEYRSECVKVLRDSFNIMCDAHHHEVATAGQCEIDMFRDSLTSMADNVMTYK